MITKTQNNFYLTKFFGQFIMDVLLVSIANIKSFRFVCRGCTDRTSKLWIASGKKKLEIKTQCMLNNHYIMTISLETNTAKMLY